MLKSKRQKTAVATGFLPSAVLAREFCLVPCNYISFSGLVDLLQDHPFLLCHSRGQGRVIEFLNHGLAAI